MTSRRQFFLTATAVAGGTILARTCQAFTITEAAPDVKQAYRSACTRRNAHTDMIAAVRRTLKTDRPDATERDIQRTAAAMSCPLCGCSLASVPGDAPLRSE